MKSYLYYVIALVIISAIKLFAQAPDTLWLKTYGAPGSANEVALMPNGGFLFTGDFWFGSANQDAVLARTNASGDTLWYHTYEGGVYGAYSSGYEIEMAADSTFFMCGFIYGDAYLVRVDAQGNTVGTYTYHEPDSYYCGTSSIDATMDGGMVMSGWANFYYTQDQIYLVKVDSGGTLQWSRNYGGPLNEGAAEVRQLPDSGYAVLGGTLSYGAGGNDVYLIRTNSMGDTLWTRTYGGTGDDWGDTFLTMSDGGFLILAMTRSFGPGIPSANVYLIRTDASGDTLWTRIIDNGGDDYLYSLTRTSEGGYICSGSSMDGLWVVKLNANANVEWETTYQIGVNEFASWIRETPDGGYIVSGGVKFGASANPHNIFLMKLGYPTDISDDPPFADRGFELFQNYPNPFNPETKIQYHLPKTTHVKLEIFNMQGQKIRTLVDEEKSAGSYAVVWDGRRDNGEPAASSVYIDRLRTNEFEKSRKLLLLR